MTMRTHITTESLLFFTGVLLITVHVQNKASWMKDAKWGVMLHYSTVKLASENLLVADALLINQNMKK